MFVNQNGSNQKQELYILPSLTCALQKDTTLSPLHSPNISHLAPLDQNPERSPDWAIVMAINPDTLLYPHCKAFVYTVVYTW